jgi:ABC-type polysaccharide/polyol phosphate export permease
LTQGPALDSSRPVIDTGFVSTLWRYRLLVVQLVRIQLLLRYRRTALGFVWTLVNPVLMMSVSAFVFSHLLNFANVQNYAVFLFSGMLPWMMFSNALTIGGASILSNEQLLRKVALPLHALPISAAAGVLIDSLCALLALFLIVVLLGAPLTPALLVLPLSYLILFVFCAGCALLFAVIFVFFRDMQHIITVLLQAMMYMTPIIYPLERIPERFHWILQLNPMYYLIRLFREPIYDGSAPGLKLWVGAAAIAITTLVAAALLFTLVRRRIVYRL